MKYAILGSTGQLGCALMSKVDLKEVVGVPKKVDLQEIKVFKSAMNELPWKPDVLINAAAYTDVDGCELNVSDSERVNYQLAVTAALWCSLNDIKFVQVSTDYVFNGLKNGGNYVEVDQTNPLNTYGVHKRMAEQQIIGSNHDHLVVRTSRLFSEDGRNFMSQLIRAFKSSTYKVIPVVDDQFGSPTYTIDLAEAIINLVSQDKRGVYHVANTGTASWYSVAKFIADTFSTQKWSTMLRPIPHESLNLAAPRPLDSSLSCAKLNATGYYMRPWNVAAEACVRSSGWLSQI